MGGRAALTRRRRRAAAHSGVMRTNRGNGAPAHPAAIGAGQLLAPRTWTALRVRLWCTAVQCCGVVAC